MLSGTVSSSYESDDWKLHEEGGSQSVEIYQAFSPPFNKTPQVSVALSGSGRFSAAHLVPSNAPVVPLKLDIVGTENGQVVFSEHVVKHRTHPRKTTLTCSGTFTQTDPDTGQPITITIGVIGFLPHGRR